MQGLNPGLLPLQVDLLPAEPQGKPICNVKLVIISELLKELNEIIFVK